MFRKDHAAGFSTKENTAAVSEISVSLAMPPVKV